MPENPPVAENIKKVESREKKRLKTERKKAWQPPPEGTVERDKREMISLIRSAVEQAVTTFDTAEV